MKVHTPVDTDYHAFKRESFYLKRLHLFFRVKNMMKIPEGTFLPWYGVLARLSIFPEEIPEYLTYLLSNRRNPSLSFDITRNVYSVNTPNGRLLISEEVIHRFAKFLGTSGKYLAEIDVENKKGSNDGNILLTVSNPDNLIVNLFKMTRSNIEPINRYVKNR